MWTSGPQPTLATQVGRAAQVMCVEHTLLCHSDCFMGPQLLLCLLVDAEAGVR